jgi:uncharacterized LabA/DUF88 family protein
MQQSPELRLAVLIDADNVPSDSLKEMMEEVAKYGTPTFKRIYGDWTNPHLTRWKGALLENAITPIQQYGYTTGKNSTDSAMIIDAMDILYTGKVDGFCIISSDSDFTRLALRLREAGMLVIGMGQRKTPMPFIAACNKFVYIEILAAKGGKRIPQQKSINEDQKEDDNIRPIDEQLIEIIRESVEDLADEDGWAFLGEVGNLMLKKQPDFDPRNYGCSKLMQLIKETAAFEIDERSSEKGTRSIKLVYIKPLKLSAPKRKAARKSRPRKEEPSQTDN